MLINTSEKMSKRRGLENKLIRVPKRVREELNLKLGELLILDNGVVLQVEESFIEDTIIMGDNCAFVTPTTRNRLNCSEQTLKYANDITLGCDPELFLIDDKTGYIVNPSRFFNKWHPIGTDGMLCELRPFPSITADGVTSTLKDMMKKIRATLDKKRSFNTKILCRSNYGGISAGFHCHMGLPPDMLNQSLPNYDKLLKTIVRVLDYYVGVITIIPEGSKDSGRRCAPHINYGKASDHRIDNRTLEYRVPGGALLKSPELTAGLLELCSMVTRDAVTRLRVYTEDFTKNYIPDINQILNDLYPNIPKFTDICKLICVPSITEANKHVDKFIIKDLEHMFNYTSHKKNIDILLYSLNKEFNNDVNKNWE